MAPPTAISVDIVCVMKNFVIVASGIKSIVKLIIGTNINMQIKPRKARLRPKYVEPKTFNKNDYETRPNKLKKY